MSVINIQPIKNRLFTHNKNYPEFSIEIKTFAFKEFHHMVIGNCMHCKGLNAPCQINHNSLFEFIFEVLGWDYIYSHSKTLFQMDESNLYAFRDFLGTLKIPYKTVSANEVPRFQLPVVNRGVFLSQLLKEDEDSSIAHKVKTNLRVCPMKLKAGQRKGEPCGKPVHKQKMCYRHYKNKYSILKNN